MVSTAATPVPSFNDILYGDSAVIGVKRYPRVVEAARADRNSEQAQFIRDKIDYQTTMQQAQTRGVRAAGTVVDLQTGQESPGTSQSSKDS